MKSLLAVFLAGAVFAAGLAIGGMTQPARIFGFLDFTGRWDPTLMAVMGGALVPYFFFARVARRRAKPLWVERFHWPLPTRLDAPLVAGAAIFGAGWGLSGYCPGPGVVALVSGNVKPVLLVLGMAAGFLLHDFVFAAKSAPFGRDQPSPAPAQPGTAAEGDG